MSDAPRRVYISVSGLWMWDGDGTSTRPEDIAAYNDAMEAVADAVRAAGVGINVTLVGVEVSG